LAAGESSDAADQRETQLLIELDELFPDLKSSAEKFAKLSDGYSPAEGEFVQEVFEPELGEKLGRIVQELASGADRGAAEDRRNIERALKHSYRRSILVVLFGVAVSAVLAAVISRTVIAPIQKLRDAAHQLGHGKMDTRIVLQSKDELGTSGFLQPDGRRPYEAHEGARPGAG